MTEDRHIVYTTLLERHRAMLWRMCLRWAAGDYDRCRDLLQEVSIAIWVNLGKLRPGATPAQEQSWVRWQARSVFYQAARRRRPALEPLTGAHADSIAAGGDPNAEILDEMMAALAPDERRMLQLYLEGYQGEEIGERMGISRDTYYQRMHRAIHKMRRVGLVLLALLLSTAVAIAVVPRWRHLLLPKGSDPKGEVDPTPPHPLKRTEKSAPGNGERETENVELTTENAERRALDSEPVEHLPSLSMTDIFGIADTLPALPPLAKRAGLTIYVDGNRLFITGDTGEEVRVYDMSGSLVAAQNINGFCIIDLYPCTNAVGMWRYRYRLQIGRRPAFVLQL